MRTAYLHGASAYPFVVSLGASRWGDSYRGRAKDGVVLVEVRFDAVLVDYVVDTI
ncbi:MAG: hypothetical protein ACKOOI_10750 [Pirellula sp.]